MIALTWRAIKALGVGKKLLLLFATATALFVVIRVGLYFIDSNNAGQRMAGENKAINDGLIETFERTEKAREATKNIGRDPVAARNNCLRHSRTPENCGE